MPEATTQGLHPMQRTVNARIPTAEGEFWLYHYRNPRDQKEHLAIVMGEVDGQEKVLVRVHSECFTGDVLGSRRCDCGDQLQLAMAQIALEGCGAILYLRQEGRGIGLEEKLKAYNLQDEGFDTVEANLRLGHQADERQYWAAAGILADLGIRSIRLLTNNPDKIEKLEKEGIRIDSTVRLLPPVHADNFHYLNTKIEKMRHMLSLPQEVNHTRFATNGHTMTVGAGNVTNGNGTHQNGSLNGAHHTDRADNSHAESSAVALQLAKLQQCIASHQGQRPFVTVTWAQSIDGSLAGKAGEALRLSSDGAMRMTHSLRTMHDAILVGVGTVLQDNPKLTTRLVEGPSPRPVIVDSRLRTPLTAALFEHPHQPIFATQHPDPKTLAAFQLRGAKILQLPAASDGRLDLAALLVELGKMGIRSLMVEGGAQIISSFIENQLGNAVVTTIAPRFVGGLRVMQSSIDNVNATNFDYTQLDGDMVLWGSFE